MKRKLKKQTTYSVIFVLFLSDLISLLISCWIGLQVLKEYGDYAANPERWKIWFDSTGYSHLSVFFLFVIFTALYFTYLGHYHQRRPFWDELLQTTKAIIMMGTMNGIAVFAAKWPTSRVLWLFTWSLALIIIPFFRYITKKILSRFQLWQKKICILGVGENALNTAQALHSEKSLGYEITMYLRIIPNSLRRDSVSTEAREAGTLGTAKEAGTVETASTAEAAPAAVAAAATARAIGTIKSLPEEKLITYLRRAPFQQVYVSLEADEWNLYSPLLYRLSLEEIDLHYVPPLQGLPLMGVDPYHFFSHEMLMLKVKNNLDLWISRWIKRIFDFISSTLLLILLSPLFIWISFTIMANGQKAFFRHVRVGKNGRSFRCIKFQTMVNNSDQILKNLLENNPEAKKEWEIDQKLKDDPRVTSFGLFLRRTSLDELPQLWNVFMGDMSLVGPRPITFAELKKYHNKADFYLASRPGITGLWQVSGRNEISYEKRVSLDAWYVKNWSLWYDIAILVKTVQVVLNRKGAY